MRTAASLAGHPVHMMLVHFPVAFLLGASLLDWANLFVQHAVLAALAGQLLVLGLAAGLISVVPGLVDFLVSVRPNGGNAAGDTLRHAIVNGLSLIIFGVAWLLRGDLATLPSAPALVTESLGAVLLGVGSYLGASLVLKHRIGSEPGVDETITVDSGVVQRRSTERAGREWRS